VIGAIGADKQLRLQQLSEDRKWRRKRHITVDSTMLQTRWWKMHGYQLLKVVSKEQRAQLSKPTSLCR